MANYMLLVAVLGVFFLSTPTAANVTSCYVCQSPFQPECDDPFDIVKGRSYRCNELFTGRSENPGFGLIDNLISNERLSNTITFETACIKVGVDFLNGTTGILRNCFIQPNNIDDICTYITNSVTGPKAISCHSCNENLCNSATGIYASILTILLTAVLHNRL